MYSENPLLPKNTTNTIISKYVTYKNKIKIKCVNYKDDHFHLCLNEISDMPLALSPHKIFFAAIIRHSQNVSQRPDIQFTEQEGLLGADCTQTHVKRWMLPVKTPAVSRTQVNNGGEMKKATSTTARGVQKLLVHNRHSVLNRNI